MPMAVRNVANAAHMRMTDLRRQNVPTPPPQTVPGVLFEGRVDPSARVYRPSSGFADDAPSRVGASIASLAAAHGARTGLSRSGFRGLGGDGRACTSTGAQAAQGILGAIGGTLTTLGSGGFRSETTTTSGGVVGSQGLTVDTRQNLQIAGATTNILTSLYTNICDARTEARTGTVGTASQTAMDWRNVASGLTQSIQQTQRVGATTNSASVTTPPGDMPSAGPAAPAAAEPSKTWMYVAGGVAVAAVLGIVVLR